MRWRAAAKKQRIDLARLAEPAQFFFQCSQKRLDQFVAPRDQREIAIAAAMPAKRHVNIRRPRRYIVHLTHLCHNAATYAQAPRPYAQRYRRYYAHKYSRPSSISGILRCTIR